MIFRPVLPGTSTCHPVFRGVKIDMGVESPKSGTHLPWHDAEGAVLRLQRIQIIDDLQTGVAGNVQVAMPPGISLPEEHVRVDADERFVKNLSSDGIKSRIFQQGSAERCRVG